MMVSAIWKKHKLLSTVFLVYLVLAFVRPDKAVLAVQNSLYYVFEMLMIMPVIFILTALIEAWVPKATIIAGFGKQAGFKGNVFAFLLGSFSAGPIYAAFPVCKMLLKKGASIANIVIVLSAWAVVKVPMLANEAKFLGPDFMLMRWALTTVAIFLMAYLVSIRVKEADLPTYAQSGSATKSGAFISEEYCIGCGLCARRNPEVFVMRDGKAYLIIGINGEYAKAKIRMAAEKCPAKAIICDVQDEA